MNTLPSQSNSTSLSRAITSRSKQLAQRQLIPVVTSYLGAMFRGSVTDEGSCRLPKCLICVIVLASVPDKDYHCASPIVLPCFIAICISLGAWVM